MTHLIKLAAGKLNDPILMDWALDRYRQASKGQNHRQEELEQAWFDELTLRRWLNNDDQETLNRLFVHLPEKQFANLAKAIGERWNDWSGSLAYHSAQVLARYQPDLAKQCFAEPPGGRHRDIESILGIVRSLPVLPHDDGLQLLKTITQQILISSKDSFTRELMLSELVSASLALDRPRYGLGSVEQALVLEPNAVEAVLQKADAMAMQGDKGAAFQLLDQSLESKEHWRFFLTDVVSPAQLTAQFAHLYNELLRGLGRTDRASLHASFHGTSKKVGRNDPCPCGSGKKYKKCCLAKH